MNFERGLDRSIEAKEREVLIELHQKLSSELQRDLEVRRSYIRQAGVDHSIVKESQRKSAADMAALFDLENRIITTDEL